MALESKVDSFLVQSTDVVTTTIPVTGLGFTPKAIFFWWSGRGEAIDTLGRASAQRGFGFATGIASRACEGGMLNNAVANSNTDDMSRDDACVCTSVVAPAASVDGLLDLDSLDADGFTMIVDDQFANDIRVHFMALGGDSITNTFIGSFAGSGALGNQSITGVGFLPDFVAMMTVGTGSFPPTLGGNSQNTVAAMISSTQQGYWCGNSLNGQATSNTRLSSLQGPEAHASIGSGSPNARFSNVSMDADGFTIDWLEADADVTLFIALQMPDVAIGQLDTRTDGADIVISGLGFEPTAVMFVSGNRTENGIDGFHDDHIGSIGAASSPTERGAQYVFDKDAVSTMEVSTALEFDAVYIHTDEAAAPAIDGLMDLKSLDADGFTCVMDDPDPSANFVMFWAFGPAAAVDVPGRKARYVRQGIPAQGGVRA